MRDVKEPRPVDDLTVRYISDCVHNLQLSLSSPCQSQDERQETRYAASSAAKMVESFLNLTLHISFHATVSSMKSTKKERFFCLMLLTELQQLRILFGRPLKFNRGPRKSDRQTITCNKQQQNQTFSSSEKGVSFLRTLIRIQVLWRQASEAQS